jgi:hypothetical protein
VGTLPQLAPELAGAAEVSAAGQRPKPRRTGRPKLGEDLVRMIRASRLSIDALARELDVDRSTVARVRAGLTWKRVPMTLGGLEDGCIGYAPAGAPGYVMVYAGRDGDGGRPQITVTLQPEEVAALRDWLDAQLQRRATDDAPDAAP